ncbi:MAG: class I SAM-dependent methyltransferase [Ignavibacteriaceae bacterium]
MEITSSVSLPDKNHPNYKRWKKGRELAVERGKFASAIINKFTATSGLSILDLGSGEGGTSSVFSENNFVVSADYSIIRLTRQHQTFKDSKFKRVNCNGNNLPFADGSFNLIILQDVIEHIEDTNSFLNEVYRVLKYNGIIYISTPNRFSVLNILSDPHWGLPLLALLSRSGIRRYYLKHFRKSEVNRVDLAQLYSLRQLYNLLNSKFDIQINTKYSVHELLKGNNGIVWSDFHLELIKAINFFRLSKMLLLIANDRRGFINNYFTPTFYLLLKRK